MSRTAGIVEESLCDTEGSLMSMPPDWLELPLSDLVLEYRRGISYERETIHDDPDEKMSAVPYLTLKSFAVGGGYRANGLKFFSGSYKNDDLTDPGDVLVANTDLTPTSAILGAPIQPPSELGSVLFSHHVSRLRLAEHVGPAYMCFLLSSPGFRRAIPGLARGTTVRNLDKNGFLQLSVRVPPLGEQRKIAAILSSVDDAIEATQAVIDQLQVVKKAMMAELLTRGVPGRHTRFKRTEIGEVPEEWATTTYGELAAAVPGAIQSGPFGSELKHSEFVDDGYLVVGIDNVLDGRFSVGSNHRITPAKFDELRRFEARPGDLLITVMATVGRCCVVPEKAEPAIITKHIYRLTADRSRANPYFLMYCLYGIQRLADEVRGSAQGLTRPGLNKSLLLPLRFPLPPLTEQDAIVDALQAVDQRLDAERQTLGGLRPVKSALMSVLLTGEVRVTPDEAAA